MSATLEYQTDNLYLVRLAGNLKKSELDELQAEFVTYLAEAGAIRLLIVLENFTGWDRAGDWGDNSFFITHGDLLERIAIVGEPAWEAEMLVFVGAGVRKAPVRYYPPSGESQARVWLSE
jgi:hypothetical protein